MDTGSRKWGRPYLNRRFFSLLGERMADKVLLIMAKRDGRFVAGALNMIGSDALYGRYWGAVEDHPFLHFEVCYYQAIDFALAHGLKRVEAGAQGAHKLARGYLPTTTHSAHYIADPSFRRAVADYLENERREVAFQGAVLSEHAPFRHGDARTATTRRNSGTLSSSLPGLTRQPFRDGNGLRDATEWMPGSSPGMTTVDGAPHAHARL